MKSSELRLDLGVWQLLELLAGSDQAIEVHLSNNIVLSGKVLDVTKGGMSGSATVRMQVRPSSTGYGSTDRFAPNQVALFDQRSVVVILMAE